MPTENKYPDSIAASTNLSGTVADIDEDPTSPDASWLTATSATAATDLRVTFPTPSGTPTGTQRFNYALRKTAGTPNPTIVSYLYQGGVERATLENGAGVSSTTGEEKGSDWQATSLATVLDGSDVELRIAASPGVSGGSVGALPAWSNTTTIYGNTTLAATHSITLPATINPGDLLIIHVGCRTTNNNGAATVGTSGWTAFAGNPYGGSLAIRTALFWRIAVGNEDGTTVSVTGSGGSNSDGIYIVTHRFTAANGFDATTPVVAISSTTGTASPSSAPTVTPTGTNQRAVCLTSVASSIASHASFTGETGGDWVSHNAQGDGAGADGGVSVQTSNQSGGGAISGGTSTLSPSAAWSAVGFALKPAETPGTNVNTVEVGACEWVVNYADVGSPNMPAISNSYRHRRA